MASPTSIQLSTDHRPYPMPTHSWQYYQEWNDVLFIHFQIDNKLVKSLIPQGLHLDTYNDQAYMSIVAFKMEKIRPRFLPSVSFISDFYEINVRTYIEMDGRKGVYFLNIEAEKEISAWIARMLSGLPYEKSTISRTATTYINDNQKKSFYLNTTFKLADKINNKTILDLWLTERYCLFLLKDQQIFRYDIHHKEWPLKQVQINNIQLNYTLANNIHLNSNNIHSVHYSAGVQVLSWNAVKI